MLANIKAKEDAKLKETVEVGHFRFEATRWAQERFDLHIRVQQLEKSIGELKTEQDKSNQQEADLTKTIEILKNDVVSSYKVGFEAAFKQAAIGFIR